MCPPELFPAVTVVSHLVHHLLALPILLLAMAVSAAAGLHAFPWTFPLVLAALVPWILTTGGAVFAVSVLSVHYRDMRDLIGHLLNLLFFSSPIIYSLEGLQVPLASLVTVYRNAAFDGQVSSPQTWLTAVVVGIVAWWLGTRIFEAFRETVVEAV